MNLFYQPLLPDGVHYLDQEESRHSTRVLRMKAGDVIHVTDGKGFLYISKITIASPDRCSFEVEQRVAEAERRYHIHLAIAPTRQPDRLEWFTEKAVEVGIDRITLIACDHSTGTRFKLERLRKIAVSAMKQSVRFSLPIIDDLIPVRELVSNTETTVRFIAYVGADQSHHLQEMAKPGDRYLVLIGPEGDFSAEELSWSTQHQFLPVSLGAHRLRTETAGIAACHILNLVNTAPKS